MANKVILILERDGRRYTATQHYDSTREHDVNCPIEDGAKKLARRIRAKITGDMVEVEDL